MSSHRAALLCMAVVVCQPAWAAPRVVTDLPAVHSLVSVVLGEHGSPDLLMQGAGSPHDYRLRPSEAANLQDADLLVWVSAGLTPWLDRARLAMSDDLRSLELLSLPSTQRLAARDAALLSHDGHEGDEQHEEHEGNPIDPHAWLDPANAQRWLNAIASALGDLDPSAAQTYRNNANLAIAEFDVLADQLKKKLEPVADRPFAVFHDSFQYFEKAFGLQALTAIRAGDAADPGPARSAAVRQAIQEAASEHGRLCVFTEPQFNASLARALAEGSGASFGELDPIGAGLAPGADLYPQLLTDLADAMADCMK